jgi:uncharacterized protein YqgC (DUF456 family)
MNGINILNSTEVVVESTSNYWLAGIVWILVIIACGMIAYGLEDYNRGEAAMAGCLIGAMIGLLFWVMTCAMTSTPTVQEVQYEITIDDSVSMKEFTNKYEIIEQRGEIYVVREKVE